LREERGERREERGERREERGERREEQPQPTHHPKRERQVQCQVPRRLPVL